MFHVAFLKQYFMPGLASMLGQRGRQKQARRYSYRAYKHLAHVGINYVAFMGLNDLLLHFPHLLIVLNDRKYTCCLYSPG
jgi:hypothetical protein